MSKFLVNRRRFLVAAGGAMATAGAAQAQHSHGGPTSLSSAEKHKQAVSAAGIQMPRDSAKYDELSARYGLKNLPRAALPLSGGV